jgi:hypothetical protein
MPASFEFRRNAAMDRDVEVWVPRQPPSPIMERRGVRNLSAIARMRERRSDSLGPGSEGVELRQLAAVTPRTITAEKGPDGTRLRQSHLTGVVEGLQGIDPGTLGRLAARPSANARAQRRFVERQPRHGHPGS